MIRSNIPPPAGDGREGFNKTFRIVNDMITFIQERGYEPGERLPSERDFTNRFAVGRGVIREALTFMEVMRLIERRRSSGIFLTDAMNQVSLETLMLYAKLGRPLDRDTLRECTEVRKILELQAVAIACERRTIADLELLRSILARSDAALEKKETIAELDLQFHMAIFGATQNDIFRSIVKPFYLMSHERRNAFFAEHSNSATSHGQHVAIVEAIVNRDAAGATDLMDSHIGRVQRYLTKTEDLKGSDA